MALTRRLLRKLVEKVVPVEFRNFFTERFLNDVARNVQVSDVIQITAPFDPNNRGRTLNDRDTSGNLNTNIQEMQVHGGAAFLDQVAGNGQITLLTSTDRVLLQMATWVFGAATQTNFLEDNANNALGPVVADLGTPAATAPIRLITGEMGLNGGTLIRVDGGTADDVLSIAFVASGIQQ